MVIAPIIALLLARGPAAIARAIVAIISDALKRMLIGWSRSHICIEIVELLPSLAELDTSPAVVFIRRTSFILASFFHIEPRQIFWPRPLRYGPGVAHETYCTGAANCSLM